MHGAVAAAELELSAVTQMHLLLLLELEEAVQPQQFLDHLSHTPVAVVVQELLTAVVAEAVLAEQEVHQGSAPPATQILVAAAAADGTLEGPLAVQAAQAW